MRRMTDSAVTDLPQPDSPTTPRVERFGISNETPSTARITPCSVRNSVTRSRISRRASGIAANIAFRRGAGNEAGSRLRRGLRRWFPAATARQAVRRRERELLRVQLRVERPLLPLDDEVRLVGRRHEVALRRHPVGDARLVLHRLEPLVLQLPDLGARRVADPALEDVPGPAAAVEDDALA